MIRDELIETMARAGIRADIKNDENARCVATFMVAAIEAKGLAIVPVEATSALTRTGEFERHRNKATATIYRAMIEAGRI